ncbi:hypothetical protein HZH68_012810 [Vespula germanica]|uniref:Uncharacterized protein n=1 Tax=Vespula germanica TaxID=30212 RepID=A0A834JEH6_VESGE|nr:hypothetical protein HZH68_012810 [Vespula germanica]
MCESLEYSDDRLAVITTEHACFASGTSLETSMTGSEKTELFQTFGIGLIQTINVISICNPLPMHFNAIERITAVRTAVTVQTDYENDDNIIVVDKLLLGELSAT